MLLVLLDDVFNLKTKIANYNFYLARTVHKSSLSPSIHSLLACEVGDLNMAYNFFKAALHTDISNIYGNSHEGIHAASLGGTWQALVFGFAGVKIKKERISVDPRLPRRWQKVSFSLLWQGKIIKLELTNETIKLKVQSRKPGEIELEIFGKVLKIKLNKVSVLRRSSIGVKKERFY